MGRHIQSSLALVLFAIATQISAQIVTDGTRGTAGPIDPPQALTGPAYSIPDTLGTQVGPNLFHSFSDFNINSGESATFSSAFTGVTNNVLSRVTGANLSNINGLLESTIPGADFFFINPNGIIFGPNATLNVPASFNASTADIINLENGGVFHATDVANTILTMGNITSLNWTSPDKGTLTVQGSTLEVSAGNNFQISGGGIDHL